MRHLPRVLFVAEAVFVEALRRLLRSRFAVVQSSTALAGLARLDVDDDFDAIALSVDDAAARTLYGRLLESQHVARRVLFITSASDPAAADFLSRTDRPWLIKPFATEDLTRELAKVVSTRLGSV